MTTLTDIEQLTRAYADARGVLSERVAALQQEMEAARRRRLRGIREAAARAADARGALHAAVEGAPELFERPRTVTIAGIKIGWQKGRGEIVWDDAERVVALINRHLTEQADVLIRVTEMPIKSALAQLSAADLRRIGVTVVETGDQVVIRPVDGEIDRLVDALLREAAEEVEA